MELSTCADLKAFDAVDGNTGGFQVNVGALEHADFGSSEAVPVGDGKDGSVAFFGKAVCGVAATDRALVDC